MIDIINYFRENIITLSAIDMFDKNIISILQWYMYLNASPCVDIKDYGFKRSGVYPITIKNTDRILYLNWADYKNGFGQLTGEFWLGNDYLHLLTKDDQDLRVDLVDFDGNTVYAKYTTFAVGSESEKYKFTVGGYSGTAGASLNYSNDSFSLPKTMITVDIHVLVKCAYSNLNGLYYQSAKNDFNSVI